MSTSDHFFRRRLGPRHVNDELGDHLAQIEPMVEPVGEGAEVGLGVLAVLQRLEGARHHGLQVAQHGVDPLELGQVPGIERAQRPGLVDTSGFGDQGETPKAVPGDDGLGQQAGLSPLGNGFRRETANHIELKPDRLTDVIHRDGGNKENLVPQTPAGLASGGFTDELSLAQPHGTAEQSGGLLAGHGVVNVVVEQLSSGVAQA
jgi:hypothetical protein